MYKHINIFVISSLASFVLMIVTSILANFFPGRNDQTVKIAVLTVIFSLFLIFVFSLVPVMISAVLRGNIAVWQKYPVSDQSLFASARNFIINNEEKVFYGLLAFFWGIFILGLLTAVPFMIKQGVFKDLFSVSG